jgi:hypothetical protein
MIAYWKRVARSAPAQASPISTTAAPAAAPVTTTREPDPAIAATPSPKPMQ